MCIPGSIISSVRMVALFLSAVTVVTISAPRTASRIDADFTNVIPLIPRRLSNNLSVAASSISNALISRMPSSDLNASTWNSLCAPQPLSAIDATPGLAMTEAASAEVAAVRSAVETVSSLSNSG